MWLRKFKTIVARTSRRDKSRQQRPISGMRIKAREEQNADTSISYLGYADQRKTLTGPQRPILGMRIKAREKHRPTSGMSIKARALGTATTYLGHADQKTRKHERQRPISGMRIPILHLACGSQQERNKNSNELLRACGYVGHADPQPFVSLPRVCGYPYDLPRVCKS